MKSFGRGRKRNTGFSGRATDSQEWSSERGAVSPCEDLERVISLICSPRHRWLLGTRLEPISYHFFGNGTSTGPRTKVFHGALILDITE